jgi:prevent-host-death family protein
MISVNATEFKNKLGQFLQKIYAGPIVIHKMGRPTAVLLAYEEYERLQAVGHPQKEKSEKEQALEKIRQAFKGLGVSGAEGHE